MSVTTRPPRSSRRRSTPVAELIDLGAPVRAKPSDSPVHQLRAALDSRVRALLAHDPGTRVGQDPEELHQMRVAVRRMRAALKAARPLLDRVWADDLRAELGWLGRALGPVRDADVLIERLRGRAAAFDDSGRDAAEYLFEALVSERETARGDMLTALHSDRYIALLRTLAAAVSEPLPTAAGPAAGPALRDLVHVEFRRLAKSVRRAGDDPPDEVLHALRIQGKRLRYTGELAVPVVGKRMRKLVESTVALQDVLGEHQDACVAQRRVIALLDSFGDVVDLDVVFVAGRLVEREDLSRLATRAAWSSAWLPVQRRAQALDY
ncbi:MAG: CHAD domain-containing protein [Pseudonocardiaceae bacterium]